MEGSSKLATVPVYYVQVIWNILTKSFEPNKKIMKFKSIGTIANSQ